jgi:hypothetical protein
MKSFAGAASYPNPLVSENSHIIILVNEPWPQTGASAGLCMGLIA